MNISPDPARSSPSCKRSPLQSCSWWPAASKTFCLSLHPIATWERSSGNSLCPTVIKMFHSHAHVSGWIKLNLVNRGNRQQLICLQPSCREQVVVATVCLELIDAGNVWMHQTLQNGCLATSSQSYPCEISFTDSSCMRCFANRNDADYKFHPHTSAANISITQICQVGNINKLLKGIFAWHLLTSKYHLAQVCLLPACRKWCTLVLTSWRKWRMWRGLKKKQHVIMATFHFIVLRFSVWNSYFHCQLAMQECIKHEKVVSFFCYLDHASLNAVITSSNGDHIASLLLSAVTSSF